MRKREFANQNSALYFPYVSVQKLETLKKALLFYDNLLLMVPPTEGVRSKKLLLDLIMQDGYDLADSRELRESLLTKYVSTFSPRMERDDITLFTNTFEIDNDYLNENPVPSDLTDIELYVGKVRLEAIKTIANKYSFSFKRNNQSFVVPPKVGLSILTTHALKYSNNYRTVPITDEVLCQKIFSNRILVGMKDYHKVVAKYPEIEIPHMNKLDQSIADLYSKLTDGLFGIAIPSLEKVKIPEIIEYKVKYWKELKDFQNTVRYIINDYFKYPDKSISYINENLTDVKEIIEQMKDGSSFWNKFYFFKRWTNENKKIVATKVLPFAISSVMLFNPSISPLAGLVAGYAIKESVDTIQDLYKQYLKRFKGFNYLIHMSNEFGVI